MKALALILLGIICLIGGIQTPYMKHTLQKVSLISKKEQEYHHKGVKGINYIFILKDNKNRIFDLSVTDSLYARKNIGDIILFDLNEMHIKQTIQNNIVFFLLPCIISSIFIALGLATLLNSLISTNKRTI